MIVEVVKKGVNRKHRGDQWLVKATFNDGPMKRYGAIDRYYIVSAADVMFSGPEVLVFPADKDGNITSWGEVAGLRGTLDHLAGVAALEAALSEEEE